MATGVPGYVVRARDGANQTQDGNLASFGTTPTGPTTIATFTETFEGPGGFDHPGWEHVDETDHNPIGGKPAWCGKTMGC